LIDPDTAATRFAPSTTGPAHPGTLLSALLCWLDARSRGAAVHLRLEDLDPERCRPEFADAMRRDLAWLGLDWDGVITQSDRRMAHEAALDTLAAQGWLYPCDCSRSRLKSLGRLAPDGGFAYDNLCRERPLPGGGWRAADSPLRVRLPDERVSFVDELGLAIDQTPSIDMGDPVVRRRDGAIAYHLASVVDDAAGGFTRLIRGRDLAPSAPTQRLLYDRLGLPVPTYRHHFLLLEPRGDKLAKFHGSVGVDALRATYSSEVLVGALASWAGLNPSGGGCRPPELVAAFEWSRVRRDDLALAWDGRRLVPVEPRGSGEVSAAGS
jgi:glutamyl-Q tRNA(Asp) synthetase